MLEISICIPTYNQSAYLEKAIRSAYNQTRKPMEIIVCNDCSTDDTIHVLERIMLEIPVLKVFHQPVNVGISKNVDTCLRMAMGEFILRLDSDDLIFPEYLEKVSGLLQNFPEAGYGHVSVQEVDQYDKENKIRQLFRTEVYQSGDEALRAAVKGYKVAANIIMFRKVALDRVGYINSKVDFAEDWRLSVSIAAAGYGNVYLQEVLAAYRLWEDAGKVRQHRKLAEIRGIKEVFTDSLEPAYLSRGWNLEELLLQRSKFAAAQSDCLGWSNYTNLEKKEITSALLQLSATNKVKTMIWIYGKGYGSILLLYSRAKGYIKKVAKKLILSINSNQQTV